VGRASNLYKPKKNEEVLLRSPIETPDGSEMSMNNLTPWLIKEKCGREGYHQVSLMKVFTYENCYPSTYSQP
jgi:hypothetical protein